MPLLQRVEIMNHHHIPRREEDDDESTLPPPPSRNSSALWAPPPPPALGPEPSYHTQLLLSEMFSQQAILRNYDPDTIQAVMMALDEERQVAEKQALFNEESTLSLARMMVRDHHDDTDIEQNYLHFIHRAQTNLNPPLPQSPSYPDPAMCMPTPAMMKRDNSSSESSGYTTSSSGRIGESTLSRRSAERPRRACASDHHSISDRFALTMEEIEVHAIEAINPLPPKASQRLNSSRSSSSTGSHESDGKDRGITHHGKLIRKLAPAAPLNKLLDTDVANKEMAAVRVPTKSDASATNTTPSEANGKRRKRKNRECLICQRTTAECKMHMRKLTCGHHFCSSCIDRWLATKDTCPYCRQHVEVAQPKAKRQQSLSAVST